MTFKSKALIWPLGTQVDARNSLSMESRLPTPERSIREFTASLGLPERTIFFALVIDAIPVQLAIQAKQVIIMPAAIQDISIFVPSSVTAAEVTEALQEGAGELLESVKLFDKFQREGEDQVSLAFTMTFRAADRTLTSEEVSKLRESAGAEVVRRFKATIRS